MDTPETDEIFAPLWAKDEPPTDAELHEVTKRFRKMERERDEARREVEAWRAFVGPRRDKLLHFGRGEKHSGGAAAPATDLPGDPGWDGPRRHVARQSGQRDPQNHAPLQAGNPMNNKPKCFGDLTPVEQEKLREELAAGRVEVNCPWWSRGHWELKAPTSKNGEPSDMCDECFYRVVTTSIEESNESTTEKIR